MPKQLSNYREVVITNSGHVKFTHNPGVAWASHKGGGATDVIDATQRPKSRPPGSYGALASNGIESADSCLQHPLAKEKAIEGLNFLMHRANSFTQRGPNPTTGIYKED